MKKLNIYIYFIDKDFTTLVMNPKCRHDIKNTWLEQVISEINVTYTIDIYPGENIIYAVNLKRLISNYSTPLILK